jgi:uncharacterized protein YdeI (YjbR/CyaY-like superfamily)
MDNAEEFYAPSRQAWREWLKANHQSKSAVWLVYDKGPSRSLTWEAIVQEALCFGWVDSRAGTASDTKSKIYVSKRKPTSGWSKINKAHVAELERKGLMASAGKAAIELAKQNGTWDKFTKSDNLIQPPELIIAFESNYKAKTNFDAFSDSSKRQILQWLYDAKTTETLAKRVERTVAQAELNLKSV